MQKKILRQIEFPVCIAAAIHAIVVLAVVPGIVLMAAGCREKEASPPSQPAAQAGKDDQTAGKNDVDELAVPSAVVVTAAPQKRDAGYEQTDTLPCGTLRGRCFVSADLGATPAPEPIDFKAAGAILDPMPGEPEFFQNLRINKDNKWYFDVSVDKPLGKGARGIIEAVVMIADIKGGSKAQLLRVGFCVVRGKITTQYVGGYGLSGGTGFAPAGDCVLFGTSETYPCIFQITRDRDDKAMYSCTTEGYSNSNVKPGERVDPRAFRPNAQRSSPIEEPGLYRVTCKRHSWQRAALWLVNNPYVAEVRKTDGVFQIDNVPAGTHTVEVWHPYCVPVKKTLEVEIRKDEVTELPVEFRLPVSAASPFES